MNSSETEQGRECEKQIMAMAGRSNTALCILASSCSGASENRQSACMHVNSVFTSHAIFALATKRLYFMFLFYIMYSESLLNQICTSRISQFKQVVSSVILD